MAKTGFWLRGAKGKLAGSVLYQANGSTIQREIVKPNNPQSDNQMRQRIGFAAASKFYQQAQQNRFVLAFPNKGINQSTFNAWMSMNLRQKETLIYPTKEQVNNPNFCAYYPWICSVGRLPKLNVVPADDFSDFIGIAITAYDTDASAYFTNWDQLINANKALDLQYGDIITLTAVTNDMHFDGENVTIGNNPASWMTRQFRIGDDLSGTTLENYLKKNGFTAMSSPQGEPDDSIGFDMTVESGVYDNVPYSPKEEPDADIMPVMAVATRSRFVNGKLQVSNSEMWCSLMAQQIYTRLSYDSQLYEAIESYKPALGAKVPANILEGSLIETPFTLNEIWYISEEGSTVKSTAFPVTATNQQHILESAGVNRQLVSLFFDGNGGAPDPSKVTIAAAGSGDVSKLALQIKDNGKIYSGTYKFAVYVRNTATVPNTSYIIKYDGKAVFQTTFPATTATS